ncbi:MAG: hypothetical protein QHI48_08040, partial [Bacteroidota bacterium]|nr:hypothetical protein [Bacteroidota bacterium]
MNLREILNALGATGGVLLFILSFTILTGGTLTAQTPQYYVGQASATSGVSPSFWQSNTYEQVEYRYPPNQFNTVPPSGYITKVYWRGHVWQAQPMTYTNLRIWIGQNNNTYSTAPATWTTGLVQVYNAATTVINHQGNYAWFGITLQMPVPYNPTQTIVIRACHDGVTGASGTNTLSFVSGSYAATAYGTNCSSGITSNPSYRFDFGLDLGMSPYFNDAGLTSLASPLNICPGNADIAVNVRNYGVQPINTVTIKWVYDNVPQPDVVYNTPIPIMSEATVTLATNMPFTANVAHTLKAWTHMPNNVPDSSNINDTLVTTIKPAISGTFTIGGVAPNYPTFAAAVADLNANGICGPVVFNVRSGTYNETITLMSIGGTSATNTITFQSETGNRNDVVLQYTQSSQTGVVNMSGADYVTFQNMTIKSNGSTYSNVITFNGGSDHNRFNNCILQGPTVSTTSTYNAIVYSASGTMDEYNEFLGNQFIGGSYGTY